MPVAEIARLVGVHERTLYRYVQKYCWRRRYDVPGAPLYVTATGAAGQATVSWTPGPDGFSPITTYKVVASPGGTMVATDGNTTTAMVFGV